MRLSVLMSVIFVLGVLLWMPKPVYANNFLTSINTYRQSKGLPAISPNTYTCSFANLRAKEAVNNFSHAGFYSRVNSKTLPYPRYRLVTENLAWAPGGQDVVNMWIQSPAHAANLLKNTRFGCVGSFGNYHAFEGWS